MSKPNMTAQEWNEKAAGWMGWVYGTSAFSFMEREGKYKNREVWQEINQWDPLNNWNHLWMIQQRVRELGLEDKYISALLDLCGITEMSSIHLGARRVTKATAEQHLQAISKAMENG